MKASGLIKLGGNRLWFAQFGEGPPALFLHGGLANSNYWAHQVAEVSKSHSVTVLDTQGHGRSPLTTNSFSYRAFAEDVVSLLDSLHISQTAVIGWSDGAITGLELVMSHASRVTKLFAFGANTAPDGLIPGGSHSPVFAQFVKRCKDEYQTLSPHPEKWPQLVAGLDAMWRSQPDYKKSSLSDIKVPTAISDGEYDEIIRRAHTAVTAEAIPHAQLLLQPHVSHFAMLQNPEQFNKVLLGFLAG